MIFVTHDLGVLRAVADRALVLETGVVREQGQVARLLGAPQHEYTAALVASIPDPAEPPPSRLAATRIAGRARQHPAASERPAAGRRAMRRVFHADYVGDLDPLDYERARLGEIGAELVVARCATRTS